MKKVQQAYIGLGSNLGSRSEYLAQALKFLEKISEAPLQISKIYESPSLGVVGLPAFLNQVALLHTTWPAESLLYFLKGIELLIGRQKRARWHSREIDLDLLLYGNQEIQHPYFYVPHIQITKRQFVLKPLLDIHPHLTHPITGIELKDSLGKLTLNEGNTLREYEA